MTDDIKLPEPDFYVDAGDIPCWYQQSVRAAVLADRVISRNHLKNPIAVHSNMCRGIIASITFDQLAHVLGDEAKRDWLNAQKTRDDQHTPRERDMAMLIKRMASLLKNLRCSLLAGEALDYLRRHDLDGEVMRDEGEKE